MHVMLTHVIAFKANVMLTHVTAFKANVMLTHVIAFKATMSFSDAWHQNCMPISSFSRLHSLLLLSEESTLWVIAFRCMIGRCARVGTWCMMSRDCPEMRRSARSGLATVFLVAETCLNFVVLLEDMVGVEAH